VSLEDFPFPLADPPEPVVTVTNPCGCAFFDLGEAVVQVGWCDAHDPGYEPPSDRGKKGCQ
jgi:hypothetical protein